MALPITEIYEYMAFYMSQNEEYLDKLRLKGVLPKKQLDPKVKMDEFERKLKIMSRQK